MRFDQLNARRINARCFVGPPQRAFLALHARRQQPQALHRPQRVVNLAAQAGVRYSITNPNAYVDANLVGFGAILEACRHHRVHRRDRVHDLQDRRATTPEAAPSL